MTDEVIFDNLDEAPEATEEAVAAVEALPEAEETEVSEESAAEEAAEQVETETSADAAVESEQDERDAGTKAVEEFSKNLRTLEGKWYVLHTYSGYEKRVKTNVESRVASFGLEDKIFQIEVPMEEVEKHTEKGKKIITRVRVPGYVLIRMLPDENARRIVRETEGVTGFVGPTKEPAPLSRKEVVSMMAPMIASEALKKAGDKPPRPRSVPSRSPTPSAIRSPSPMVRSPPWPPLSPTWSRPPRSSPCSCPSLAVTLRWSWASTRSKSSPDVP